MANDIEQAAADYADDLAHLDNSEVVISEQEREAFINNSFCDSQGCY